MYNFSFKGRASRAEFWRFFIINIVMIYLLGFILSLLDVKILYYVFVLWVLVWFVAALAMGWRRCHDLNKPGYLALAMCIPYLGFFALLYIGFAPGYKEKPEWVEI